MPRWEEKAAFLYGEAKQDVWVGLQSGECTAHRLNY